MVAPIIVASLNVQWLSVHRTSNTVKDADKTRDGNCIMRSDNVQNRLRYSKQDTPDKKCENGRES